MMCKNVVIDKVVGDNVVLCVCERVVCVCVWERVVREGVVCV